MPTRFRRMRKISVCLDEETYVSLKIMSTTQMNSAPISELIRAAIYEWRVKHPLEFLRPSPAETRRHFRRLREQIDATFSPKEEPLRLPWEKKQERPPVQTSRRK
jgi:hypothetical protein